MTVDETLTSRRHWTRNSAKSSEKSLSQPNGAAESAAIDAELAIVTEAWLLIGPHSRSIVLGMSRNALSKRRKT
jgi:hypothetical protein